MVVRPDQQSEDEPQMSIEIRVKAQWFCDVNPRLEWTCACANGSVEERATETSHLVQFISLLELRTSCTSVDAGFLSPVKPKPS